MILNPTSGRGAGHRYRSEIQRELDRCGLPYDIVQTEGPGHATELAAAAARDGISRVVAAGGDGTAHEVANGLLAAAVPPPSFGLIPIGTGNDFVKMVPGTSTLAEAVATLVSGTERPVDVGLARWNGRSEHFVNAMGTGIDVEVVRRLRRSRWLPGTAIYVGALLRALVSYRPLPLLIDVDGAAHEQRIMNLAVCNGPSIGGSFRICPDARFDDGLLDACVIGEMPMHRNLRLVPRVLAGTHAGRPDVTMLRGRRFALTRRDDGPLYFQLDGELRMAEEGSVNVVIEPHRLNVISRPVDDSGAHA